LGLGMSPVAIQRLGRHEQLDLSTFGKQASA
jgi:hypothetical protein